MKKFIKYLIIILGCALFSTAVHAQKRINTKELVVTDSCTIKAGDPATNKIAVSMDGNGRLKWVYFTDFQDSINQGVFDTIIVDSISGSVGSFDTVQIRSVITDSSAHLIGRDTNGVVRACYARCEDIRWTTVDGTQTVLRDSTDNVGIGTSNPTSGFHVISNVPSSGETRFITTIADTSGQVYINAVKLLSGQSRTVLMPVVGSNGSGLTMLHTTGSLWPSLQTRLTSHLFESSGETGNASSLRIIDNVIELVADTFQINTTGAIEGAVLTALDISGNATWQDPTGYGEMGFGDSTRTIALTQNVFSVVTNSNNTLWSTAAVDLHNVTYSGDSLIIDSAGTYQVNVQLSMDGSSGSVIRLGVFINGVLACSCTGYQELLNNRILQLNYINIDALNAGDVLQVVITNTANNDDVDAIGGKLTINKIRW
jgi:hypothetical protein